MPFVCNNSTSPINLNSWNTIYYKIVATLPLIFGYQMAKIKKNSDSYSLPTTTKQIFVWQQHVFVVLFIDNNTDCFALQACRQYHSLPMTKVTTNKMFGIHFAISILYNSFHGQRGFWVRFLKETQTKRFGVLIQRREEISTVPIDQTM